MNAEPFWKLTAPTNSKLLANWNEDAIRTERIKCPVNPGHQRGGRRFGKLNVYLPRDFEYDFVWTWHGDCLITARALDVFVQNELTGFEAKPAVTQFRQSLINPPDLLEMRPIGWGGMAPESSGIRLIESCSECDLRVYSTFTRADRLIDQSSWDGSDFFIVWPLPGFYLISAHAREVILSNRLTGVTFTSVETLSSASATISPGKLEYWLPQPKARKIEQQHAL